MPNTSALSILSCVLWAVVMSTTAAAGTNSSPFMDVGRVTSQPIGHYQFCLLRPSECGLNSNPPQLVALTDHRWEQLQQVNNLVNVAIRPATDLDMFGVPELWIYPATRGDCEDCVLLKRRILTEGGWPVDSLLITVVVRPDGQAHAVLTVRTDRGDLILDNLDSNIQLWSHTPYVFVKRQSDENTGRWVSIEDGRDAVVRFVGE